jgi:putative endonuclease
MSRVTGAAAEEAARAHLEAAGLALVARNYSCRYGEIDLIMREGETLVFVEVRSRSHRGFGGAAASIDQRKQDRLKRTAEHYLQRQRRMPPCRFDVVTLDGDTAIDWIINAI